MFSSSRSAPVFRMTRFRAKYLSRISRQLEQGVFPFCLAAMLIFVFHVLSFAHVSVGCPKHHELPLYVIHFNMKSTFFRRRTHTKGQSALSSLQLLDFLVKSALRACPGFFLRLQKVPRMRYCAKECATLNRPIRTKVHQGQAVRSGSASSNDISSFSSRDRADLEDILSCNVQMRTTDRTLSA